MVTELHSESTPETLSGANRRRSPWRRRLVEAERGLTQGFRGDSALVVHLFVACLVVAAGLVLGLSLAAWAMLVGSFTLVLAAELFNKLARIVCRHAARESEAVRQAASIGTAAVFVTVVGGMSVAALLLGGRLVEIFGRQ
ncbi:MAG TPA: diacylglycerol kinase [Planctomycetaceae bacterium]|nr:diacylglycerol kinase [Planctomycetaceae bacterium]